MSKFKVIKNLLNSASKVKPTVSKNIHRGFKSAGPITKQKKSFLARHKGKVGAGGLVAGGAVGGTLSDNLLGKATGNKSEGNVTVYVQKKYITQNLGRR